jgi:2-phosphosulfolactate phosphatase
MSRSVEPLDAHRQRDARVAFEWGRAGVEALSQADIAVVVDVLSFTTTLSVAQDAGALVLPHPWREGASVFARAHDATLALDRSQAGEGQVSLSPASMRRGARPGQRIVLPSPNGATLTHRLAGSGSRCVGACLRNATAVAAWIAAQEADRIAVIAAGEAWPDGSLRPAVEDLWGAGAVIGALGDHRIGPLSTEARTAASAYAAAVAGISAALRGCASGRELIGSGFGEDVQIAGEIYTSASVPLLDGPVFINVAA